VPRWHPPGRTPFPSLHRRDLALHKRNLTILLWGLGPLHTGRRDAVLSRSRPSATSTLRSPLSSSVHSIVQLLSDLGTSTHGRW
jgi:hypothetical protein